MRKCLILFAILITVGIALTACQPTPDEPIVISKNDGKLQEAIYGEQVPSGKYNAPNTWQTQIKGAESFLKINVDAKISVPDVEAYPVYRAVPHVYTDIDAENFISTFIGDEQLYHIDTWRTKDAIMKEILQKQNILNDLDDDNSSLRKILAEGGFSGDEYKKEITNDINSLQAEYTSAPATYQLTEAGRNFRNAQVMLQSVQRIYGFTKDGKKCISIIKGSSETSSALTESKFYLSNVQDERDGFEHMAYVDDSLNWSVQSDNLNDVRISYNEALKVADKTVKENLGYKNWDLCISASEYYEPTEYDEITWRFIMNKQRADDPQRYVFIYTQRIDGIPLLYYAYDRNTSNTFGMIWKQQCLSVIVDDNGVYSVSEMSSLDIDEKLNENVKLLPFEKIQDIFTKYIPMQANYDNPFVWYDDRIDKYVPYDTPTDNPELITLNINDIRLGYIRIKEKDGSQTSGLLVPVWMFYGEQVNHYARKKDVKYTIDENNDRVIKTAVAQPYLCINAIDGSIIDLTQGY